jgi:two-component system, OmpR family, phosphate regulon sensor histidine kinase PhoR
MDSQLVNGLLQGLPAPALLIDDREWIIAANAAALSLFGQGIVGRHYVLTLRQPALRSVIEAAVEEGRSGQARHVIPGPSHEVVHRVSVGAISGKDFFGVLCVFEDVSEQEQISQMRRDFVANVSHELRTPLTALLGFIETLKGAARDDASARERFLTIMEREAGRMNRLVSDLLHLSRVEAEERVRPTEKVDVVAVIQSAITTLRPLAESTQVTVELIGEPGPILVPGDADQLVQVFQNLIENAVKYGGADRPVTVAIAKEAALRGPAVRIEVIDRGEGIDPIHLPRLTERFYRVDTHRSREKGGTGLGLAIVKHMVNRHRGALRINSTLGKGSVFTVILPEQ